LCAAGLEVDILASPDLEPGAGEDPRSAAVLATECVAQLTVARFDAFLLTGGETAAAILGRLRATRLELLKEMEPGIALSRILDGDTRGALCVTKAGGFG